MSITISLPVEIESALRQRAAVVGTDVESFVRQIVLEEVTETPDMALCGEPHADFAARLRGLSNGMESNMDILTTVENQSMPDAANEIPTRYPIR